MIQRMTPERMKREMEDYDRDYYSLDGLATLLDYYDSMDENIEFDVIAICCAWNEYDKYGSPLDFEDLVGDYGYLFSMEDFAEEFDPEEWEQMAEATKNAEYLEALISELQDRTTVLEVPGGGYLIASF